MKYSERVGYWSFMPKHRILIWISTTTAHKMKSKFGSDSFIESSHRVWRFDCHREHCLIRTLLSRENVLESVRNRVSDDPLRMNLEHSKIRDRCNVPEKHRFLFSPICPSLLIQGGIIVLHVSLFLWYMHIHIFFEIKTKVIYLFETHFLHTED